MNSTISIFQVNILKLINQIWSYELANSSPPDHIIARGDNSIATNKLNFFICTMVNMGTILGAEMG